MTLRCERRWNDTSLIANSVPEPSSRSSAGRSTTSNSPASARFEAGRQAVAVDRRQEADPAEVDREHGHVGIGAAAQRPQRRAVAAEHEADVGIVDRRAIGVVDGVELQLRRRRPWPPRSGVSIPFFVSSGRMVGDDRRALDRASRRVRFDPAHRCRLRSRSLAAAARRSSDAGARALAAPDEALAIAGRPGQARRAEALNAEARARAPSRATSTSASTRSRGIAHDAALADPLAPDLELRLDQRDQVEARRRAAQHRGQHLAEADEGEVGDDQVGPVGKFVRAPARARCDARSRSRARPGAASSAARRSRRRPRSRAGAPALEQAVAEAAGRGAEVEAERARDLDRKLRQARARASGPRATRSGCRSRTEISTSPATLEPGLDATVRSGPIITSPAITEAAARLRDSNSPRSTSSASKRVLRRAAVVAPSMPIASKGTCAEDWRASQARPM